MHFVDTHVHLAAPDYAEDQEQVIAAAQSAGVTTFLAIGAGYGESGLEATLRLASRRDDVWASVGVHPHEASAEWDFQQLEHLAQHPRVVAIGETGLDFFRELSPRAAQEAAFREQIALARRVGKPLIIHCRDAGTECLRILTECHAEEVGGVFHCFSEDSDFAAELLQLRFLISFPGNLTFKKAQTMREVAARAPLEQILLETDGPYLAPEPHRGKRCESAMLIETAKVLAQLRGISLEELAHATTANAKRLFDLE